MKKRIVGIDIFKLIAAIFVIGIHTYFLKEFGEPYYTIVDYVFRFAVPFFFACSGFFFMKKIKGKEEKEIKDITKLYLKKLLKLWLIWGSIYFITGMAEKIINSNSFSIQTIIRQVIKALVVQPGGGLWYINTVIYTTVFIYLFYKSDKDLKKITIFFGIFYLFNYLWGMDLFKGSIIGNIYNKYMSVMSSDRFFLFKGFYFIIGMNINMYIKSVNKDKCIIGLIAFYIAYVLTSIFGNDSILLKIICAISKVMTTISLFEIGCLLKDNIIHSKWLSENCGKMSHIIYFTGSLVILLVRTIESWIGLEVQNLYSLNFIVCSCILIAYSITLLKTERGKQIYKTIY